MKRLYNVIPAKAGILSFIFLVTVFNSIGFAQQEQQLPSIFEEGAENYILSTEIDREVIEWTKGLLGRFQDSLKKALLIHHPDLKREFLISAMVVARDQAMVKRLNLLLTIMTITRALRLEHFFKGFDSTLVNEFILIPAANTAIDLFLKADVNALIEMTELPEGEVRVFKAPKRASYTKEQLSYCLSVGLMSPSYEDQVRILKLTTVWVARDLFKSLPENRNSTAARKNQFLGRQLVKLDEALQEFIRRMENANVGLQDKIDMINTTSDKLFRTGKEIVPEETTQAIKNGKTKGEVQ